MKPRNLLFWERNVYFGILEKHMESRNGCVCEVFLQSLEILHESSKEIIHVITCGLALAYF